MAQRVLAAVEGSALLLPPVFGVTRWVWRQPRWVWRQPSLPTRAPRVSVNANPLEEVRDESLVV